MQQTMHLTHIIRSGLCLLTLAAFVGCSEETRLVLPDGTAEGTVLYNSKPVPYALIILQGESSSTTANADEFGKYKIEYVPKGTLKVGVNTEAGRGLMRGAMMAAGQDKDAGIAKPTFTDVPAKFHNPDTSGMTITTVDGPNQIDIVVK